MDISALRLSPKEYINGINVNTISFEERRQNGYLPDASGFALLRMRGLLSRSVQSHPKYERGIWTFKLRRTHQLYSE